MVAFYIITLFIIPANILLLLLLKFDICKKTGNKFSLLFSYGTAPLLSGLVFYYLIWILPKENAGLYVSAILFFWGSIFFYSKGKIKDLFYIYNNIAETVVKCFFKKKSIIYLIIFLFLAIFSIQAFAYPIAENDSAYYFAQSEALNQSKDARWYEKYSEAVILLNEKDSYTYNKMIRPGIPSVMAFSFLFGQKEDDYGLFNFFFVYYYYLLLGIFLLIVSRLAIDLGKDGSLSKIIAFLFFIFYWNMTRFFIFGNKEVVIYFLALAGIYLVYDLIIIKKRDFETELLLGVILGINSFVNFHGIIIGIFMLGTLFIFSKLSFWQRICQSTLIFSINLFFSAFELVQFVKLLFLKVFNNLLYIYSELLKGFTQEKNKVSEIFLKLDSSSLLVDVTQNKNMALSQSRMYQVNNFKDVYLKGKLQIITNIGSYGFYFVSFLLILAFKFKEIAASVFGKIILFFMIVYYLVIIDPFNLNKNDLAIVLWGSPKYGMLIVLFSIIIISVYFDSFTSVAFRYIYKNKLLTSAILLISAVFFYIFKSSIIVFGLKALLRVIQVSRSIDFYANKINLFFYVMIGFIVLLGVALIIFYLAETAEKKVYIFFISLCLIFMISPFFIVSVGKVPINETFNFLNENRETKLQNIIYFGDLFKVYYYAKNTLPEGTVINTNFLEIHTYNNYFRLRLRRAGESGAKYEITNDCLNSSELYRKGTYSLCEFNKPS